MRGRAIAATLLALVSLTAPGARALAAPDPAALLRVAESQRKQGHYPEAIKTYEQALQLAPASGNADLEWRARGSLALTYKLSGDPQRALHLNEQNLAFVRHHRHELIDGPMNRERDSLQALAADYVSTGDLRKAAELFTEALKIDEHESELGLMRPRLMMELGILQVLSADPAQAEKTLWASLQAFETARRARMGAGVPALSEYEVEVEVIRWLERLLVAQGRGDEALELAEKGRARAFAGILADRLGVQVASEPAEGLTLRQMKETAAAQKSVIVAYSLFYKYDPDLPLQFSDYTKIPATDVVMWVIQDTGQITLRQQRLEPPMRLGEVIHSLRESIGVRGRGAAIVGGPEMEGGAAAQAEELRHLYRLLIQPIADLLPTDPNVRVTFIPQDALLLVPFAALQDDDGKFLIERHTLATAPSIQMLDLTHQQEERLPVSTKGALVVGNPTMPTVNGQPLPPLPGTEAEAKAVAALLKVTPLVGGQATKRAALAQVAQARVIHLATHGLLDDSSDAAFSSLALAPADGDSGLLAAREIRALKLNAELVVLSACDTGLGKISGADGVVGLSQSIISAGASSVLVSLWKVHDSPTVALMTAFYEALRGGADKDQALRQAMLLTMKQYPNPADWAAFTLIGDAGVSKPLRAALATGMAQTSATDSHPPEPVTRYTVFPVPADVQNYSEEAQTSTRESSAHFTTALTLDELMTFYRSAFTRAGLREDVNLRWSDKKGFSIVFRGTANGHVVVQGTDGRDLGWDRRTLSVRLEPDGAADRLPRP